MSNNIMAGILTLLSILVVINVYAVVHIWTIEQVIDKMRADQYAELARSEIMRDSLHDIDKNVRSLVVIKDSLDAKEIF